VDTGQSVFKGPDKRSPCFFTCKEAQTPERYLTKRKIRQLEPDEILHRLFNEETQKAANSFAAQASAQVNKTIDLSVQLLNKKHAGNKTISITDSGSRRALSPVRACRPQHRE